MNTLKLSVIFLILHTAVTIEGAASCPSPEAVSPCTCYTNEKDVDVQLECSDQSMTLEQLKNILNSFREQKNVGISLELANLGSIPSDFFKGLSIKKLELSQCTLSSLTNRNRKPFEGLEDSLETLKITSSFTGDNELSKFTVSHLSKLREINLGYNKITELSNDWFKDAPSSLRRVTISNNRIQKVGDRVFADIANLEFLAIDGNRWGPVSRSMFPNPANELDVLILINNALTSIPEDFFANMPYLRVVSLNSNGILRLPEKTWKPVWTSLDSIDLRDNPLKCDLQMRWMSRVPTCADISGRCNAPRERKGDTIPYLRGSNCVS